MYRFRLTSRWQRNLVVITPDKFNNQRIYAEISGDLEDPVISNFYLPIINVNWVTTTENEYAGQVTIPMRNDLLAGINARPNGKIRVLFGYEFQGVTYDDVLLDLPVDSLTYYQGAINQSIVIRFKSTYQPRASINVTIKKTYDLKKTYQGAVQETEFLGDFNELKRLLIGDSLTLPDATAGVITYLEIVANAQTDTLSARIKIT